MSRRGAVAQPECPLFGEIYSRNPGRIYEWAIREKDTWKVTAGGSSSTIRDARNDLLIAWGETGWEKNPPKIVRVWHTRRET